MSHIKYLRQAEVERFFAVMSSPRDRALFGIIYYYGLRVAEASLLELTDVDLAHHTLFLRRVKSGQGGESPLLSQTASLLKHYLPQRWPTSPALFNGRQGRLSPRRIQQLFKTYARQAGLDAKYSVHSLRHSIATHLLDAGLDVVDVKAHLGHVNIASTLVYAQVTDKRRLMVFQQLEHSPDIAKV